MTDLYVTNFNRNFTGVSATAANVLRHLTGRYDLSLVGCSLPGCPEPVRVREAYALCRTPPSGRRFAIWHVRRNSEMRAAILARDCFRLPIRTVFTSAAQRRHSAIPRWLISRMDAVIATTETAGRFVPNVHAVIPHGVDTDRFTPAEDRAGAWRDLGYGGTMGIATIGRIRPEKGTDLFVEAMIRALPELPGAVALVVGRGERRHRAFELALRDRVRRAGLPERIRFVGEVPSDRLPGLMRSLSAVMQLPRYEGYGMVPLEAMASGVPFIGPDTGYFGTFSGGGRSGLIVRQGDAAEATRTLLQDSTRLAAMGRNARRDAERFFSAREEADAIAAIYESLWADI